MKFWIIEKGNVIIICPTAENTDQPKEIKTQIAKKIIEAIKNTKEKKA